MPEPHHTAFSRRRLLVGMGVVAIGAAMKPAAGRADQSDATQMLLSLVSDRAKAAQVGAAWLQEDDRDRPRAIETSLLATLKQQGWEGGTDRDDLRTRFGAAVAADYESGEVFIVDGWQIARVQAELCALAYLAETGTL